MVKRPAGAERERRRRNDRTKPQGGAPRTIIDRQVLFVPDSDISTREPPWECCWNGTKYRFICACRSEKVSRIKLDNDHETNITRIVAQDCATIYSHVGD